MNERQAFEHRVREHLRSARKRNRAHPAVDGRFHRILGIRELRAGQSFKFASASVLADDPRLDDKLVLAEMASDLLTQALKIDGYDPILSAALRGVIHGNAAEPGRALREGTLHQHYFAFQMEHRVYSDSATMRKMSTLTGENPALWYDDYRGRLRGRVPLAYAVRNILAHPEIQNPRPTDEQILCATHILAVWTQQAQQPAQPGP